MQTKFLKTRFVNLKTKRAMGISYCLEDLCHMANVPERRKKSGGKG